MQDALPCAGSPTEGRMLCLVQGAHPPWTSLRPSCHDSSPQPYPAVPPSAPLAVPSAGCLAWCRVPCREEDALLGTGCPACCGMPCLVRDLPSGVGRPVWCKMPCRVQDAVLAVGCPPSLPRPSCHDTIPQPYPPPPPSPPLALKPTHNPIRALPPSTPPALIGVGCPFWCRVPCLHQEVLLGARCPAIARRLATTGCPPFAGRCVSHSSTARNSAA